MREPYRGISESRDSHVFPLLLIAELGGYRHIITMFMSEEVFYDEKCNLLLARIKKDKSIEYLFIHFGTKTEVSFCAYFESSNSNTPMVYTLNRLCNERCNDARIKKCFNSNTKNIIGSELNEYSYSSEWKPIRINGFLSREWSNYFVQLEETLISDNKNTNR